MLYSIESENYIDNIPHQKDYERWRERMADEDYKAVYEELSSRISGSEIQTSSWIPGSDWTGTVFQPIYEDACEFDQDAAAKFFGLILWQVILESEEVWSFGRYRLGTIPIEGLTYFRVDP